MKEKAKVEGATVLGAIAGASVGGVPGAIIGGIIGLFLDNQDSNKEPRWRQRQLEERERIRRLRR